MFKLIVLLIACSLSLSACEQKQKASANLGTAPKKIIDKATNDIHKAAADTADKLKSLDDPVAPAKKE